MSNKPTKQQTAVSVANAQAMLERFQRERDELIARKTVLADKRKAVAYDAHAAGNTKLLDGVHREAAELDSRIAGLDDAVAEAGRRLQQAREAEARAADRAKAVELRAALKKFVEYGSGVDAALDVLIESCTGMEQTLVEIHRCGSAFPSDAQLLSLGSRVLMAALSCTTFRREFPAVPPLERNRRMAQITQQWADTVERNIAQRLGDQTIEAAE